MEGWFDFAGIRSTTLGVVAQDFPPVTLPAERADFQPIPGRSGSLTILEGDAVYDDITISIGCYIKDLTMLDQISTFLRGSGVLVLSGAPDRFYVARAVNQIELKQIVRGKTHRSFNAVFRCSPYRYAYPAPAAYPIYPLVNKVTNSGFASTTGWTTTNASLSVASDIATMLATATSGSISQSITTVAGHVYYAASRMATPSASVLLGFGGNTFASAGTGAYTIVSGLYTATGTSHTLRVIDNRSSAWTNVYIDNIILIDLTAAFGAGNEPTKAWMDAYLAARYTSSWFDGTVAGGLITNPGTAAVPTITIVGSGDIDLTIGARTIHITGLASSITIDCDTGQSANGTTDLTSTVTFDYYPWTIPAGAVAVSWTGTVTSVSIVPRWRYI